MTAFINWAPLAIYVLGYVLTWRGVVYGFASEGGGRIDGDDIVWGLIAGSAVTLVWPLVYIGRGIREIYAARGEDISMMITPRSVRRRRELDERERRIENLERDMGIR